MEGAERRAARTLLVERLGSFLDPIAGERVGVQDLYLRYVALLAATVFGTPVLGLSTLLLSKLLKNPLGKAVAYEYRVTGSWDNPHVERISSPTRHTPESSAAAAPAPPVSQTE